MVCNPWRFLVRDFLGETKRMYHFCTAIEGCKKHQRMVYPSIGIDSQHILMLSTITMTERPKVLLLIPHYGGGGAEAVFALLARGLSRDKYELHLGLVTGLVTGLLTGPLPSQATPPPGITVHTLGANRVRGAPLRLLALIRKIKPRVILSGMFHLNFLVLLLRSFFPRGVQVLIRQNGTVSSALAFGNVPRSTGLLYRLLYRHADKIICQSSAMADDLARKLGLESSQLAVLPNPVDVDGIRDVVAQTENVWTGSGPHVVAVGRLSPEKGFDLLLEALSSIEQSFPAIKLVIAGTGPEEAALKSQCRRLGLDSAVRFAGQLNRPATLFNGASAFVLPSRHEGMPNALLEAAAAGLALVATPASGGLVNLLREQPGVWLTADISAMSLASSLLQALHALKPGERFAHDFIEPFRLDRAVHAYEELIDVAIGQATTRTPSKSTA